MSERDGWGRAGGRWEKAAKKGPWTLLFKIIGVVLLLSLVFGAIGMICGTAKEAAQVAKDEFGPRALLKKYEWFKDAAAQCEKKLADIKVLKGKIKGMDEDYEGEKRKDWDRVDKQTHSQWKAELDGVKASYNALAAKYNAQMSKANWRFTEIGSLPEGATEPLPREFKPYVEE